MFDTPVDGDCAQACHSPEAQQKVAVLHAAVGIHPINVRTYKAPLLVNDSVCEAIWQGQLPKRMNRKNTVSYLSILIVTMIYDRVIVARSLCLVT